MGRTLNITIKEFKKTLTIPKEEKIELMIFIAMTRSTNRMI